MKDRQRIINIWITHINLIEEKQNNGTEITINTINQENFPEKEKDLNLHIKRAHLGKLTQNNFKNKNKNHQSLQGKVANNLQRQNN